MEPSHGNDAAADDQAPVPLADRVDQLEKTQAKLIRLLMDSGVLPDVVDEPVPASPGRTVTSDGGTLAAAGTLGTVFGLPGI